MNDNQINNAFNYLLLRCFLRSLSISIPFILIDMHFDLSLPTVIISLIAFLPLLIPFKSFILAFEWIYNLLLRPGLYIFALVITIQGKQDFVAIAFYIIAAIQAYNIFKYFIFYIINFFTIFEQ